MRQPSLFESFNARSLDPAQVGRGFIFSPSFTEVATRSNIIILGPRGSGKTTLLKMLMLPALASWQKKDRRKEGARIIEEIDYVAIYIPSDFTWYPDFRRAIRTQPVIKETDDLLSYSLFRSHVLLAVCDCLEQMASDAIREDKYLCRLSIDPDEAKADAIARLLAGNWDIELGIGGIYGLKRGVARRIRHLQHLLTLTAVQPITATALIEQHPYLSAVLFDDLREFADTFDHIYKSPRKWAVCFDEVEIAPDSVKASIWQSGRSFDPRFLIKMSASPYDADLAQFFDPKTPMPEHDFRSVDLFTQSRHDVFQFSQRMLSGICSELKISPLRAEAILGSSFYDDSFDADDELSQTADTLNLGRSVGRAPGTRLAPTGFYNRKFQSLVAKDQSFANYLRARQIDIHEMAHLPEYQKASIIRKILATVVVRDEFLFERGNDTRRLRRDRRFRARKTVPKIYTGALSLFTMCEGNPRWLIGILRPLMSEFAGVKDKLQLRTIERSTQAKRIERTITTLFTLLSTLHTEKGESVSIIELIERLGDYCFDQVMGDAFNPEPVLSFKIDENVSPGIYSAIGRAINQGAMVLVPQKMPTRSELEKVSFRPGDIRGRRVRLAFILAPRYRLPLILGRSVDLSPIFTRSKGTVSDSMIMRDLFSNV